MSTRFIDLSLVIRWHGAFSSFTKCFLPSIQVPTTEPISAILARGRVDLVYLKLILTAFFWGGTFVAGRLLAQDVGPFSAAFLRFVLASGALFLIVTRVEGLEVWRRRPRGWRPLVLGLTGVFGYNVLFFSGLRDVEASRAALIIANNPIVIALLSSLFLKEKLGAYRRLGITLSVLGAMLVISRGDLSALELRFGWGEFYILGCVLCWGTYSLIGKRELENNSPMITVSWACFFGTAALSIVAFWEGVGASVWRLSLENWLSLSYLALLGTVAGFVWYYEGIGRIGPVRASQFINLVPVAAVLLAYLLLGEALTWSLLTGGALVLVGVSITNSKLGDRQRR
jgi:drug/metabolite transporter (DMT)-like permease